MSLDTMRRALTAASQFGGGFPELAIAFFGGEPLLRLDLMRAAVEAAREMDELRGRSVRFAVTTNATLLTESCAAWLAEHDFSVAVSIDGIPAAHNAQRSFSDGHPTHDDVLAGIRAARRHIPALQAALTVTPATAPFLVENLDYLRYLGIRDVQVTPDYDRSTWDGFAREALLCQLFAAADFYADHFEELSVSFLDEKVCAWLGPDGAWPCGFGWAKLAVSASGNVYGCERMIHDDCDPTWSVGNVRDGLDAAKLRSLIDRADAASDRCKRCNLEHACQHNCACVNLARTGDVGAVDDFICFYERSCIKAAACFWTRLSERRSAAKRGGGSEAVEVARSLGAA